MEKIDLDNYPNVKKYIHNLESKAYKDYIHYIKIFYAKINTSYKKDDTYIIEMPDAIYKITAPVYIFIEDGYKNNMEDLYIIKNQIRLIRDKLIVYPENKELLELLDSHMTKYNIKKEIINDIVLYDKIMNYDTIRNNILDKSKELADIEVKAKEYYNNIIQKIRNDDDTYGTYIIKDYLEEVEKKKIIKSQIEEIKLKKIDYILYKLPIIEVVKQEKETNPLKQTKPIKETKPLKQTKPKIKDKKK